MNLGLDLEFSFTYIDLRHQELVNLELIFGY